jgi:hypothetical protein
MSSSALTWAEVAERFGRAQNWWVATSGEGGPHAVPVWGVVVDAALRFYGEPSAVRSRNLAGDSRLVVHLESGSSVLVLHGTASADGPAAGAPGVVAAYATKYTDPSDLPYLPDAPGMEDVLLFTVTAHRALAWDLDGTTDLEPRRWRAAESAD